MSGADAASSIELPVPPRYGSTTLELRGPEVVRISRLLPGRAAGAIEVTGHCALLPALGYFWDRQAAADAAGVIPRLEPAQLANLQGRLRAAAWSAPDKSRRALALHLSAQALLVNDRSLEATNAFLVAEDAWLQAGDAKRASAARAARAEDLQRTGDYDEVLRLARDVIPSGDPYFEGRVAYAACLALRSRGRTEEATACLDGAERHFNELDEILERAAVQRDIALLNRELGNDEVAGHIVDDILEQMAQLEGVPAPGVANVRGRAHVLRADLALDRGEIPEALRESQLAMTSFERAGATRWLANTMLRVGSIYRALGATHEARAYADAVYERFSPVDAPAPRAAAQRLRAELDLDEGLVGDALDRTRDAATVLEQLQVPSEIEQVRLIQVEALLRLNRVAEAQSVLASGPAHPANTRARELVAAAVDVASGRVELARSRINHVRASSLDTRTRTALLEAAIAPSAAAAEAGLWRARDQLREVTWSITSPTVRSLVARRDAILRVAAFRPLLADLEGGHASAEDAWRWVAPEEPFSVVTNGARPSASKLDALIARELLDGMGVSSQSAPAVGSAAARRALLEALTTGSTSGEARSLRRSALPALSDAAAWLGPGSLLIALLDDRTHAALLWVEPEGSRVVAVGSSASMRDAMSALTLEAADPRGSLLSIDHAASELAGVLFGGAGVGRAPSRLLIVAGDGLESVPWALLPWPADGRPLVETTSVTVVTAMDDGRATVAAGPRSVVALAASNAIGAPGGLPELPMAAREVELIRAELPGQALLRSVWPAGRRDILDALRVPGTWVHIASHGSNDPNRLGYSGLWVGSDTPSSAQPEFLSWLDVLEGGTRADLVVLNACRLAQSGQQTSQAALNFAVALSRSGSRDVVGAMWPVSDAAGGLWVPVLYRTLFAQPRPDPGEALRVAQQRLRASRAFRHPAYWAGWSHLGWLPASVVGGQNRSGAPWLSKTEAPRTTDASRSRQSLRAATSLARGP